MDVPAAEADALMALPKIGEPADQWAAPDFPDGSDNYTAAIESSNSAGLM